jgi:hypothetical protein
VRFVWSAYFDAAIDVTELRSNVSDVLLLHPENALLGNFESGVMTSRRETQFKNGVVPIEMALLVTLILVSE